MGVHYITADRNVPGQEREIELIEIATVGHLCEGGDFVQVGRPPRTISLKEDVGGAVKYWIHYSDWVRDPLRGPDVVRRFVVEESDSSLTHEDLTGGFVYFGKHPPGTAHEVLATIQLNAEFAVRVPVDDKDEEETSPTSEPRQVHGPRREWLEFGLWYPVWLLEAGGQGVAAAAMNLAPPVAGQPQTAIIRFLADPGWHLRVKHARLKGRQDTLFGEAFWE